MELTKNKKRATRRKRNLIAKELKTNKTFSPKVEGLRKKSKRKNLSVKDVERFIDEYWNAEETESRALSIHGEQSQRSEE